MKLKGWITLSVMCNTSETKALEDVGIDPDISKYVYHKTLVQISQIVSIDLENEISEISKDTIIYLNGTSIQVKESPEEVINLIKNS